VSLKLFEPTAIVVAVDGGLTTWTPSNNEGSREYHLLFYADQVKWVFPRLDWLREEAERYASLVRAGLIELTDLITVDEANRTDWTRFIELVGMIGGNLENLKPEESAAVRLVNGFSSVQANTPANTELRPALHEAEKIRCRIGDRFTEAVRVGQLEVKGRNAMNLTVAVIIPASLITADRIWSLLRSGELEIAGQQYVDARIGPLGTSG
jgi:hypothetical protein